MISLQKDFATECNVSLNTKHKIINRKKKNSYFIFFKIMTTLIIVILITLTIIFNFIVHYNNSKKSMILSKNIKNHIKEIPLKPKEHWIYIKELKNFKIDIKSLLKYNINNKVNLSTQITNEQRKLLEQTYIDIHQKPVHLDYISSNKSKK